MRLFSRSRCLQVIAGEVLGFLRESGDEVARRDAVRSLCDLAERYAPDHRWFVDTMNELFEVAGALPGAAGSAGFAAPLEPGGCVL